MMRRILGCGRLSCVAMIWVLAGSACSDNQTPAGPTPAALAPSPTFRPPDDAPADAAAPPNTTRITITTIEILRPDGTRAQPTALSRNVSYRMRMWIFCPAGLEGPVTLSSTGLGGLTAFPRYPLQAGYTKYDDSGYTFPGIGSFPFLFEIIRDLVTIASKPLTMVVT